MSASVEPSPLQFLLEVEQTLARDREAQVRAASRLLRIRTRDGKLKKLEANAAQRAYAARRGERNIVLKARQVGITTWIAGYFFLKTITRPGTLTVQVAHDQRSAEEIFRIVHRFLENLPEPVRAGALRTSRANVRQLVFPLIDSEYRVETAADREAGRGLTIQNLHCSEVARWPGNAAETLAGLRAAVPPEGEIVLESTANGAGGCFYDEWQRAEAAGYVQHFFPWWMEPAYVASPVPVSEYSEEELELALREGLSERQIGFRRLIKQSFRGLAAQEFAEEASKCFLASGMCVFDAEALEAMRERAREAVDKRDSGRLQVWFPPVPGKKYVIGVDPAGGGSEGDYACAQVVEAGTGAQCAELQAHLTPEELARAVARLGREYHGAMIAVERNNHGHGVLAFLQASERYEPLFEQRGQLGWLTSPASKPEMVGLLAVTMSERPELFASERLLRECRTFVRRADGTAGAVSGAHDDCVMAMAVALSVRRELLMCGWLEQAS